MTIPWSDAEKEFLRKNAGSMTIDDMVNALAPISHKVEANRSVASIYKKARTMGVKLQSNKSWLWTPENRQYLEDHYGKTPTTTLAKHLGISARSVVKQTRLMGLRKGKIIQETPWKERLIEVYAVAEWFEDHGVRVEIKTTGGAYMAVFRQHSASYTAEPMSLYNRLLREGKMSETVNLDVSEEERRMPFAGFGIYNAHDMGHAVNLDY